ncbi:MAG: PQQ-dependent sugar dehydrogenase, partial [Saprospiraceae bacterium]
HPEVQQAAINVADGEHPATAGLPAHWQRTGEWYNFQPPLPVDEVFPATDYLPEEEKDTIWEKQLNIPAFARWTYDPSQPFLPPSAKVLLTLDETSYHGGKHGTHPIAWCQEFDGGRSFYTGLGHSIGSYSNSLFLRHLSGGIEYAFGHGKLDYSKASTSRIPPADRFVRTTLASNLDEPMELDIFPDGTIIIVERKGAIMSYDQASGQFDTVVVMPVYHEFEEGVLGLAIDPHWTENHWVYIYYSLMEGGRRNRLSRFVFENGELGLASEIMLLEVPELVGCCHAGGSVEFGPDGNLYVSTGDNTNPFESDGFNPIDERPGRALWDAQKSAGNTNDLRGKILRITPQPDGSYTIPEGNLFPPGTPGTRPEIYVMGCRNPFRISIDNKTNWLYWGDVGPDAGKNSRTRGPKGYDAFNRAKKAGNYGWPFVRGHHIYFDFDFATQKSGPLFDPDGPLNDSPNNTGLWHLPPVEPSLIWYSYDESLEFPWLGTGGKNPMAGPVFHAADFPGADSTRIFPPYFENKLFIYEWMRYWIFIVTLDDDGAFVRTDRFLPDEVFNRPMDMAFGPDGALYLLEYGTDWFARNEDARLTKIEYAPRQRKPIARLDATPAIGDYPLTVRFSAAQSRTYDGGKLTYQWLLKERDFTADAASFDYTFRRPGIYHMTLKVTGETGLSSTAEQEIAVGNTPPVVEWQMSGNQTFYFDQDPIPYQLKVTDKEDGDLAAGTIRRNRVRMSIDYLAGGAGMAAIAMGHQTQSQASLKFATGKQLMDKSDCKTCHAENTKVNGPSLMSIAGRYFGEEQAVGVLAKKIVTGGAGNWGETTMAAHPGFSTDEAVQIVRYILSLAGENGADRSLASTGTFVPEAHVSGEEKGAYVFQATYFDEGGEGVPPLSASATHVLRYPWLEAGQHDLAAKGVRTFRRKGAATAVVGDLFSGRYIGFENIDLTGVGTLRLQVYDALPGTVVELRLDRLNGLLAATVTVGADGAIPPLRLQKTKGRKTLYFIFTHDMEKEKNLMELAGISFEKAAGQ